MPGASKVNDQWGSTAFTDVHRRPRMEFSRNDRPSVNSGGVQRHLVPDGGYIWASHRRALIFTDARCPPLHIIGRRCTAAADGDFQ